MSLALAHFAIGFGSTTLLWTAFKKDETDHMLPVLVLGSIWSMMPDIHHIMPIFHEPYSQYIHESAVAYLFWFHRGIDVLDPQDSLEAMAIAVAYVCVCVGFRELYLYRLES